MKTPYKDIYQVLKLNRLIVLAVIIMAFISSTLSLYHATSAQKALLNKTFVVDSQGTILPLRIADQSEYLQVEALAHLETFHRYFYELNTSNFEEHLQKALWLADESVDQVYRQKQMEGVYNRLLQYALVQKVTQIKSSLDMTTAPYKFMTTVYFEITRGDLTDHYQLETSGELIRVERQFPKNPHGFLVTDFFENNLKKLPDAKR